jgi:hypothetical protein
MLRCFWLLLPLGEGWDEGKKAQENVNFRLFKQPLRSLLALLALQGECLAHCG